MTDINREIRTHDLAPGDVARRAGVAVSALHFYEREGLITSVRTVGNQRRYHRDVLRRIAFVRVSQGVGISLADIRSALATLPEGRTPTKADWSRCPGRGAPRSTSGSAGSRSCATPSTTASGAAACRCSRAGSPTPATPSASTATGRSACSGRSRQPG